MGINWNLAPSSKANLMNSVSQASLLVHSVMDQISAIGLPENPERTDDQTNVIQAHFWADKNSEAPTAMAA